MTKEQDFEIKLRMQNLVWWFFYGKEANNAKL